MLTKDLWILVKEGGIAMNIGIWWCLDVFGCSWLCKFQTPVYRCSVVLSQTFLGVTCSQFTSCLHAEEWGFLNCSSFHSKLQPNQSIKCSREIQRALAFVLRFLRCDSCQKNKRTQQDRQESTTNEIAKRNSVDICGPIPSTYWHVGFQYVVICGICTCLYCIFGQGVCKAKLRIKPCREQHSSVPSQSWGFRRRRGRFWRATRVIMVIEDWSMVMQPLLRGIFPIFWTVWAVCRFCCWKLALPFQQYFTFKKNTKRSTSVYPFLPHSHWLIPYNQDRLGETAVGPEKRTVAKFVAARAPWMLTDPGVCFWVGPRVWSFQRRCSKYSAKASEFLKVYVFTKASR